MSAEFSPQFSESDPREPQQQSPSMEQVLAVLDLGYELEAVRSVEREKILEAGRDRLVARHAAMTHAAELMDIITPPSIREWQPTDQELEALQNEHRDLRVRMQMLDGIRGFIENQGAMGRLYAHQQDALVATQAFMEDESRIQLGGLELFGKSGYVDMPTGTGKTGTITSLVRALKSKESPQDPIRVLVLEPTNQLVRQTIGDKSAKEKDKSGFAKFASRLSPTSYDQFNKQISPVTVMTNASFNNLMANGEMPEFDVVLIDETHTGLGDNISENIRQYYGDKLTIGFSATPDYHDQKMTSHLLKNEIFKITLPEAIRTGLLAPVAAEHREITLEFDPEDLPEDRRSRREAKETAYLRKWVEDALPDIKEQIRKNNGGVLIKCPPGGDTGYAKMIAEMIRSEMVTTEDRSYTGRIRAAALGGSTQNPKELETLLGMFRKNEVHVLTYVNIINMGTDLPNAKLLVDLAGTEARIPVVQGIGRILRKVKDRVTGKLQRARVISYKSPFLKNQYTPIDALELKPGTATVVQEGEYQQKCIPRVFDPVEIVADEVLSEVVGTHAIETNDDAELDQVTLIGLEEAVEEFNLDPERTIATLQELGLEHSLTGEDWLAVIELGGLVRAEAPGDVAADPVAEQTLIPDGHITLEEAAERAGWGSKNMSLFTEQLKQSGIRITKRKVGGKLLRLVNTEGLVF